MTVPTVKLNNNYEFPVLGCGTYKAGDPKEVTEMVKNAIDIGYRHIDAAMYYQNEGAVGQAIRDKIAEGIVKREDLFITSKLWNNYHLPDLVVPMCRKSVYDLRLDYLDLYLIHWPMAVKEGNDFNPEDKDGNVIPSDVDYLETWKQMEECVKMGLSKSIGVSNFNSQQLQRIIDNSTIKPVVNQIECHPYLNQSKLIAFCKERNVVVTAHSPLGGAPRPTTKPGAPIPLKDPKIIEIAEKHGRTVAQVIIRYLFMLSKSGLLPFSEISLTLALGRDRTESREGSVSANSRSSETEMTVPTVKLNNNYDFPVLGCGTYKAGKPGEVADVVKNAIDVGFHHIDGAMFYDNEPEIGQAIKEKIAEGVIKREDLFITSKLWNNFHRPDLVVPTCKKTLSDLGLDYVDLYLIHWPFAVKEGDEPNPADNEGKLIPSEVDYVDTWKQMEECVKLGLTKSIGLSNFNSVQVQRILDAATIKPVVNQVECHPYLNQSKLLAFCKERGIVITAYSPLGSPGILAGPDIPAPLKDPKIIEIAEKHGKTAAQIIIRYLIQHGVVPIPKSSNRKRLEENFNVFDFELTTEEVASIDGVNKNFRICLYPEASNHRDYPFNIEF